MPVVKMSAAFSRSLTGSVTNVYIFSFSYSDMGYDNIILRSVYHFYLTPTLSSTAWTFEKAAASRHINNREGIRSEEKAYIAKRERRRWKKKEVRSQIVIALYNKPSPSPPPSSPTWIKCKMSLTRNLLHTLAGAQIMRIHKRGSVVTA